jgi:hypothetical protein
LALSGNRKKFPGFDHLYELHGPYGERKTFHALLNVTEIDYVPLVRAEWFPAVPLILKWSFGPAQPGDVVSGGGLSIIFISPKTRSLLEQQKLTGWTTYPISLHDKTGSLCEGYAGLSITGRCGSPDEERGELLPVDDPDSLFIEYLGFYFDESTWDGSDFFMSKQRGSRMFVTEAVKNLFEINRITDFIFTPLPEVKWSKPKEQNLGEQHNDNLFLVSLYMDQELDPAGFVKPIVDKVAKEIPIDYTVVQPADNVMGMKLHVCSTFEEAKAYALHLQAQGIRELVILRSHQVFWRTPGMD